MRHEERMARTTDPSTSHEAAEKKAPRLANDYAVILGTLATASEPLTASEIDREHRRQGLMVSPAHKRCVELERRGLVVRCEPRVCSVTGYKAATWRIKR
jgi:predicted molibdopterin-dependent oxidoreductase YjgC